MYEYEYDDGHESAAGRLNRRGRVALGDRVDRICRWAFPIGYVARAGPRPARCPQRRDRAPKLVNPGGSTRMFFLIDLVFWLVIAALLWAIPPVGVAALIVLLLVR